VNSGNGGVPRWSPVEPTAVRSTSASVDGFVRYSPLRGTNISSDVSEDRLRANQNTGNGGVTGPRGTVVSPDPEKTDSSTAFSFRIGASRSETKRKEAEPTSDPPGRTADTTRAGDASTKDATMSQNNGNRGVAFNVALAVANDPGAGKTAETAGL